MSNVLRLKNLTNNNISVDISNPIVTRFTIKASSYYDLDVSLLSDNPQLKEHLSDLLISKKIFITKDLTNLDTLDEILEAGVDHRHVNCVEIRISMSYVDLEVGNVVYLVDSLGGLDIIDKVDITAFKKSKVAGIVISKELNSTYKVQWKGEIKNVYSNLNSGESYYVDLNSRITNEVPIPSSTPIFVVELGKATSDQSFYIDPKIIIRRTP